MRGALTKIASNPERVEYKTHFIYLILISFYPHIIFLIPLNNANAKAKISATLNG